MGMTLEVRSDIENFGPLREAVDDRGPVSMMFDPQYADVNSFNSFWIMGTDRGGKVVHLQAVRFLDMDSEAMAEKFYGNISEHFMRLAKSTGKKARCVCPMMMERIAGPSCYHGEIWLDREYRGKGLSMYLPRLLMAIAFVKWTPNYIFGLIPEKLAYCGIGVEYGYYHIEPDGMVLQLPDRPTDDRWLVWMTMDDMHRLLRHSPKVEN